MRINIYVLLQEKLIRLLITRQCWDFLDSERSCQCSPSLVANSTQGSYPPKMSSSAEEKPQDGISSKNMFSTKKTLTKVGFNYCIYKGAKVFAQNFYPILTST